MAYIIEFGQELVNQTLTDFFGKQSAVSGQRSAVSGQWSALFKSLAVLFKS
ncbi:hypothetical protein BJP36_43495 [Moorena producens JHB]|uniref:Uncharacterized protein n=1 Tax=Moorena producens (strain JHB) TaxID=1454205 RepID=A0A9Q9STB9_MOOP1|nr:hypothetical protein [Moorena producens]WAN69227.1 hypothetical protein BJP36_43495 [Moorena producens JHB]